MRFFKFFSVVILAFAPLVSCAQEARVAKVSHEKAVDSVEPDKPKKLKASKTLAKKRKSGIQELSNIFNEMQKAALVSMKVKKEVTSPWLAKPKQASGTLYFSQGKIRMKIDEPHSSLLVLSGNDIWLEEKQPEEFGGAVQVTHFEASKARKSSALLALLFGESEIWNELDLKSRKSSKDGITYTLSPKDPERLELKELKIELAKNNRQLQAVSFSDELENLTEYEFSEIKSQDKKKPELFKYSPPKGAEVTRF